MHAACASFVAQAIERHDRDHGGPFKSVLEIGGRDVNGGVRSLFGPCDYTTLDIEPGPGVDIVADARRWDPPVRWEAVVCTNVLEHVDDWRAIIFTAHRSLAAGGWFIVTTVGDPFPPHSAVDGGPLRSGEYYQNVKPADLVRSMGDVTGLSGSFEVEAVYAIPPEVQVVGIKRCA